MLSLNRCSCEVVVDDGPSVGLGCDRWGGELRLKHIFSAMEYIEEGLSGTHLSGGTACGGSGGSLGGRDHGEWLFYSDVWFSGQVNVWFKFLGIGGKKGCS